MTSKGRILKVKYGYNPNSSSIGTHINAFLLGSAIFTIAANVLIAMVISMKAEKRKISTEAQEHKSE
ncbi:MAG: hypothetical protein HQK83_04930 [Fibrobacteria bacterium]|nr:hypothetical protein [Fibrobacteria bacterium]